MTALYQAQDNCLVEQPQMENPKYRVSHWPHGSLQYYSALRAWADYKNHLASLRTIPCDPSCKEAFDTDIPYVEGKDYEVREIPIPYWDDIDDPVEYRTVAFPLHPVKEQAEQDELRTGIFAVQRLKNGAGHSNLTIITDEAIPDVYIGSLLLVPFVHGYKDPDKVKVMLDDNGKPLATKLRTCVVVEYIFS